MRRCAIVVVALLAACHGTSPEGRAAQDQHDVAMVRQANKALPPIQDEVPEPLTASDLQRYDLLGQSCAYAPGTSLATLVIAREADAFAKIDGTVERFAADPGSRTLPQRSHSLYASKSFSLRLELSGQGTPAPNGKSGYEGTIELRDAHGRVVYQGSGTANCGP